MAKTNEAALTAPEVLAPLGRLGRIHASFMGIRPMPGNVRTGKRSSGSAAPALEKPHNPNQDRNEQLIAPANSLHVGEILVSRECVAAHASATLVDQVQAFMQPIRCTVVRPHTAWPPLCSAMPQPTTEYFKYPQTLYARRDAIRHIDCALRKSVPM